MIDICRASAGSGKTFLLAKTYIEQVLCSRDKFAYRHVLAVTFTNKATEEMKIRILRELYTLSENPERSGYSDYLVGKMGSLSRVQSRAKEVLALILHDYGSFSVSTIDKFFQRTLKSFAREIGLFSSYRIELNEKQIVVDAVNRILDSLGEDKKDLLDWMKARVMEQLTSNGKFDIENSLYESAFNIKSEEFKTVTEFVDVSKFYSKSNLSEIRKRCRKKLSDIRETISRFTDNINSASYDAGINLSDTKYGFLASVLNKIQKASCSDKIITDEIFGARYKKMIDDVTDWFSAKRQTYDIAGAEKIRDRFRELESFLQNIHKLYNTLGIIIRQSYDLGMVRDIHEEFNAVLKEKNIMSINGTNDLLRRIIAGSDTPFIYEKMGVRYDNFLLDEFQDTSLIQWDNFKPLLKESLSSGNHNLIVGDIKQSIYRFRGGDWRLLYEFAEKSFDRQNVKVSSLTSNWRSAPEIVKFNNDLIKYSVNILSNQIENGSSIREIYSDYEQTVPSVHDSKKGGIKVAFVPDPAEYLVSQIRQLHEAGIKYGDIAILIRNNTHSSEVAAILSSNGIKVISEEALVVNNAVIVRRLVSLLSVTYNPGGEINSYLVSGLGVNIPSSYNSIADLCEIFLRALHKNNSELYEDESAYIQCFMDCVKEWAQNNGNDLKEFLDYWNGSRIKLSAPPDENAVTMITVHKSKGLEFNYVICHDFTEIDVYREQVKWCKLPEDADWTNASDMAENGAYQVKLQKDTVYTYFDKDYSEERLLQAIDNLNLFYVALTRAKYGLCIISPDVSIPEDSVFKNFAQIIKSYVTVSQIKHADEGDNIYVAGYYPDNRKPLTIDKREPETCSSYLSKYISIPLNPEYEDSEGNTCKKIRLEFNSDCIDFFGEDGNTGIESSERLKGTVLHKIMSYVYVPGDLNDAVHRVEKQGIITSSQAEKAKKILSSAIESVKDKGWFSEDRNKVMNEASLADIDGNIYRPDRMIFGKNMVYVIDYKFGEPEPAHKRQISNYARLLSSAGHKNVKSFLWYIRDDENFILEAD